MKFRVLTTASPGQLKVGQELSLSLVSEFLELNTRVLYHECLTAVASASTEQTAFPYLGFVFLVIPEPSDMETQ